ncbi:hypothetical protein GCM10011497_13650 [Elstera cyanobacteriorum]|uniref:DUF2975 domain-containing protein n=1 Tax=Elstera cyanobacteriorum TaxID=2022747 RepID=A0A255XLL1_9PROT|nr:DUF2975 domain-containing protein [Elstera cyanobacteriorum]OYQ17838.1 hypothetical protein CHR90_12750 [Elstera cyanobacteriorum]GFZ85622.1 hypothetical protein GCM10011497_13650 [Elstera cyanobacteriorum]
MSAVDEGLAVMARVGRRARWVIWGCVALLCVLVGLVSLELPTFLLNHPQIAPLVPGSAEVRTALAAMPLTARGLLFVILLISAAPFLWALVEAAQIARLMAAGQGFSPALPRRLRRIGWALVLTLVSRPLAGMGLTAFVTYHLSQSVAIPRATTLSFSSDDLGFALIGIAVLALAAIARSIVALADDARGIV